MIEETLQNRADLAKNAENEYPVSRKRQTIEIINENKEIVERLMQYAIKTPNIVVNPQLLTVIVPLLRKNSEDFTDGDEIALWSSYDDLTELVKPATNFSLAIAEQLHEKKKNADEQPESFLDSFKASKKTYTPVSTAVRQCHNELKITFLSLVASVIFYLATQIYCSLLSDTITHIETYQTKWLEQYKVVSDKQLAGIKLGYEKEEAQYRINQLAVSADILVRLTNVFSTPIGRVYCSNLLLDTRNMQVIHEVQRLDICISARKELGNVAYSILANYILPSILGILGASAFMVRGILEKLGTNSYVPGTKEKMPMRFCLGGLLGLISGIFVANNPGQLASFNMSLVMIALVMGYSVEVAFSLFDSVVERMRDWTESLKKQ